MACGSMCGGEGGYQHQAVKDQGNQADEPDCQTNHPVAQEMLTRFKGS